MPRRHDGPPAMFVPRLSHFESSGTNQFRGFYTLFWISLFLFSLQTYAASIDHTGYPLPFAFAALFSQNARDLALSDAVLVLISTLAVPLARLVESKSIKYKWTGIAVQYLFEMGIMVAVVVWTYNRQWPWVQSGFLTLHSFVMIMKTHSYLAKNGELFETREKSRNILRQMREVADENGGWEKAVEDAVQSRREWEARPENKDLVWFCDAKYLRDVNGWTSSTVDEVEVSDFRKHKPVADDAAPATSGKASASSPEPDYTKILDKPHPTMMKDMPGVSWYQLEALEGHNSTGLSSLSGNYIALLEYLSSGGPRRVGYPGNLTFRHFSEYLLIPTLVYDLEYPMTPRIRPLYLLEKTLAFMGTFALLYTVTEGAIIPLSAAHANAAAAAAHGNASLSFDAYKAFARALLDLALPFMIAYLLLFYIIFECICNGFAELSCFADRQFYEDWWNSTSWSEFSRKWNKPVHLFLLTHVYFPIRRSSESSTRAMFVTFLVSAVAHEIVMIVVTKKIRLYIFLLQLIQIPLILLSRLHFVRRNKMLGNVIFWLGLYAGFPLLCVGYVAY